MKKVVSILVAMGLVMVVGTPAFAQNAPGTSMSIRAQAAQIGASQAMASDMSSPSGKAVMVSGAALFLGGMGVAIYGFLNNKNGEFPEFGEAEATDSRLGATGLGVAFAGGARRVCRSGTAGWWPPGCPRAADTRSSASRRPDGRPRAGPRCSRSRSARSLHGRTCRPSCSVPCSPWRGRSRASGPSTPTAPATPPPTSCRTYDA